MTSNQFVGVVNKNNTLSTFPLEFGVSENQFWLGRLSISDPVQGSQYFKNVSDPEIHIQEYWTYAESQECPEFSYSVPDLPLAQDINPSLSNTLYGSPDGWAHEQRASPKSIPVGMATDDYNSNSIECTFNPTTTLGTFKCKYSECSHKKPYKRREHLIRHELT
jgi:hypothetical protein